MSGKEEDGLKSEQKKKDISRDSLGDQLIHLHLGTSKLVEKGSEWSGCNIITGFTLVTQYRVFVFLDTINYLCRTNDKEIK